MHVELGNEMCAQLENGHVWTTGGTITITSFSCLYTDGRHIGHGQQPSGLDCLLLSYHTHS